MFLKLKKIGNIESTSSHSSSGAHLIILRQRQRSGVRRALTELQPVPIVSFELRDETQFPVPVQGVVQAERSTQLTHTQVPLEPFGVVREGEALVALLPERNGFAQAIDELEVREEENSQTFQV